MAQCSVQTGLVHCTLVHMQREKNGFFQVFLKNGNTEGPYSDPT